MNIEFLNSTINEMCLELSKKEHMVIDWRTLSEEELVREIATCIFGSQMLYEQACAIVDHLYNLGAFSSIYLVNNWEKYEIDLIIALSTQLEYKGRNNEIHTFYPRLKNRISSLFVTSMSTLQNWEITIRNILLSSKFPKVVRKSLVEHIDGFGPKQSSLFLRRIGYSSDLAVLDVHIIDYLKFTKRISVQKTKLRLISYYEDVENEFSIVAQEFRHPLGCVDLATWITMRVAKQEGYI